MDELFLPYTNDSLRLSSVNMKTGVGVGMRGEHTGEEGGKTSS